MYFSENLIKLRKGKGWSQEDLADKLDISRQAVSKWEVGTSKPDIDNLMKLSKLFSKPIDELVNNKIVHTEAMSIAVKKRDFKHDLLLWLRGLIVLLIVLLVIDTIYKFTMLFIITIGEQKYKELDNYHYVVTTYDDANLISKEESWYKEGISKTINTIYKNSNPEEIITFIDYNKSEGYIEDTGRNEQVKLDVELLRSYNGEEQLYSKFPKEISKNDFFYILAKSSSISNCKINISNNNIFLQLNESNINLDQRTLLPKSIYYEEKSTEKYLVTYYDIEINAVNNIPI